MSAPFLRRFAAAVAVWAIVAVCNHAIAAQPKNKKVAVAAPRTASPLSVYTDPADIKRAGGMLTAYVRNTVGQLRDARQAELAAMTTPDEWRRYQQNVRSRLAEYIGDFGPKCPLAARTVGKLDRPKYVIEKVLFQTQPGYYCSANLYLPKDRKFPRPSILFTCGHSPDGKAAPLYHEACLGLVLKGYVVFAFDPMGQGERSEYFDAKAGRSVVGYCLPEHHGLMRPSWLVGRSFSGYRIWDANRAVDYMISRPEVDAQQLGVMGNSGGGMMTLLITACDERIKACASVHPGGSCEETFLNGMRLSESEILSLIPPRPCAIIAGRDCGAISYHKAMLTDTLPFFRGLGEELDSAQFFIVDGRPRSQTAQADCLLCLAEQMVPSGRRGAGRAAIERRNRGRPELHPQRLCFLRPSLRNRPDAQRKSCR